MGMRSPSALVSHLVLGFAIFTSGCQTVGDVRYIVASEAKDEGDYKKSFDQFLILANDDSYHDQVSAQISVADAYLDGHGVQKDIRQGLLWLERASKIYKKPKWTAIALAKLAGIYRMGIPGIVETNEIKAATLYRKAYELGDTGANSALEFMVRDPEIFVEVYPEKFGPSGGLEPGELKDINSLSKSAPDTAFRIVDWHARNGNRKAQLFMAQMVGKGIGTGRNVESAMRWLYLSAKNGSPNAQLFLAAEYQSGDNVPIDFVKSKNWMEKAASQDLPEAINDLAIIYLHPLMKNEPPNPKKAFELFKKAESLGNKQALINLGDFYADGLVVKQDLNLARQYYVKAEAAGLSAATRKLRELSPSGQTVVVKEKTIVKETVVKETVVKDSTKPKKDAKAVYSELNQSVVQLIVANFQKDGAKIKLADGGSGSAVSITDQYALTNCHVVEDKNAVLIKHGDKTGIARVTKRYPDADVCFIKSIDLKLIPVKTVRPLSSIQVGEITYAIGSPSGLENTLTSGHVSGIRKMKGHTWIQTSAAISPGSSGGGLFDENGALIGITTFKLKKTENINFAAPAEKFAREIRESRDGS